MNISSITASQTARLLATSVPSETNEVKGAPDHDGDADDAASAAPEKAALPPQVGTAIDKTA